jgi:hypothetical protein
MPLIPPFSCEWIVAILQYEGDLNRSLTFTSKERMKSFLNLFPRKKK